RARLCVRVDGRRPLVDLLGEGLDVSLTFLQPDAVRFSVRQDVGRLTGSYWDRRGGTAWIERGPGDAVVAAGTLLELAIPLADLGRTAGDAIAFFVAVSDADGRELERHPAHGPIAIVAPDEGFESPHWRA